MARSTRIGRAAVAATLALSTITTMSVVGAPSTRAATPTLTATKIGNYPGKRYEASPQIPAANDRETVLMFARPALQDGTLVYATNAPSTTPGYDNTAADMRDINADDLAVGDNGSAAIIWQVGPTTAYRVIDVSMLNSDISYSGATVIDDAGEIAGYWGTKSGDSGGFYLSSPTAAPVPVASPTGTGSASILAMNSGWRVVSVRAGSTATTYLVNRSTGASHVIPGVDNARDLAPDGTTLFQGTETHADGTTLVLSGLAGFWSSIADDDTVAGWDSSASAVVTFDPQGNRTDVNAATGIAGLAYPTITPGGSVVAALDHGDGPGGIDVYAIGGRATTIEGTVLAGSAANSTATPAAPVSGVSVSVAGTASDGSSFTAQASTGATGGYGFTAPPGSYTLTFPDDVCVAAKTSTCAHTAKATVDDAKDPVTVDAVALRGALRVKVEGPAKPTVLSVDPKTGKTKPADVAITVTITNSGGEALTHVVVPAKLIVGYHDPNDVSDPTVPLRPGTAPKKTDLGPLAVGRSTTAKYTLTAQGDGEYDVQAVLTAADAQDRPVHGSGTGVVKIGAPVLVVTTKMGRKVPSPEHRNLVKAGTNYSVFVTFENRSYVKTIDVDAYYCDLAGNASDGRTQDADAAIQKVDNDTTLLASEAHRIAPRHTVELACVVRTTNTPTETGADGQENAGTRSTVTIGEPDAYVVTKNDAGHWVKGAKLAGANVFIDGERTYTTSLDDTDDQAGTFAATNWQIEAYYLTSGVLKGLWGLTGGAVTGLFRAIPALLAKGIQAVPTALVTYVNDEVEMWDAAKHDPVAMAQFLNVATNTAQLAYKHAPELLGDAAEFVKKFDADVRTRFDTIANDWYHGRYLQGLEAFSEEFTSEAGNAAMVLAPGVLARCPKVVAAFTAAKASLYAQVTEDLAAYAPRIVSALDASTIMSKVLKAGYELSNTHLRQFFGLTNNEASFLRAFAKENKLLIVVRSRAAESVKWLKKYGAVLKPEAIKIKNVSWLDWKYLGYAYDDIGRVVVRTALPSEGELLATLRRDGVSATSAEGRSAIARLQQRTKELAKTDAGYYRQLEEASRTGHMDLKWNFADNAVDPSAYTGSTTRYKFRMEPKPGDRHSLVPQYFVKGKWRSVTGDVDFLQITHADGRALSDAARVKIYQALSRSPLGFMHPESATWQLGAKFDFAQKIDEFERAGTVAQFGPDGAVRAVNFVRQTSFFVSKTLYRIFWEGGYQLPWAG